MSEKPSLFRSVFAWTGGYIGCATYLGIFLGGAVGFALGHLVGEGQANMQKYRDEREAVEPIIASDPAFQKVEIHQFSAGGNWLNGEVPTEADLTRFRERVIRAIGEKRATEALIAVQAKR